MCRVTVTAKGGNRPTSNLFYHLKTKHVLEYAESQRLRSAQTPATPATQQQTSIVQAFSKSTAYDRKSKRWSDITRAITTYLCKDMVPFYTVEHSGFKEMIKTLDARYEPLRRKYFSETEMPKLYSELRDKVEKDLRQLLTVCCLFAPEFNFVFESCILHNKCFKNDIFFAFLHLNLYRDIYRYRDRIRFIP